jgi:hypothetical protein
VIRLEAARVETQSACFAGDHFGNCRQCSTIKWDDSNAQGAALTGGLGEQVISVPLLPFPVGRGTRPIRQERAVRKRDANASVDPVLSLAINPVRAEIVGKS